MTEILHGLLWVAIGSVFGGTSRYFVSGFVARRFGGTFPWGTMVVNVTGAFAAGFVAAAGTANVQALWQLVVVGFLGSYTTVSSFSFQTLSLTKEGEPVLACANIVLSFIFCLTAVAVGFLAGSVVISLALS